MRPFRVGDRITLTDINSRFYGEEGTIIDCGPHRTTFFVRFANGEAYLKPVRYLTLLHPRRRMPVSLIFLREVTS